MHDKTIRIPLRLSVLPKIEQILPFFKQIDENRWYSNHGPLVRQLEERLAEHFGVIPEKVTVVSNCTSGLTATLMAKTTKMPINSQNQPNLRSLIPSYTFLATAMSAVTAGLTPHFLDIDKHFMSLTPKIVENALIDWDLKEGMVHSVIPVSVFGARLDISAWKDFHQKTNIPVVMDMAWCADSLPKDPGLPMVVSLHATKALGCGEGGVVVSENEEESNIIKRVINFGFDDTRKPSELGFNAKMNEYSAAVALAAMDNWPEQSKKTRSLQQYYLRLLQELNLIRVFPGFDLSWTWGALPIILDDHLDSAHLIKMAADEGVEMRVWWGFGLHTHTKFQKNVASKFMNTEKATSQIVNIPFFPTLTITEVTTVLNILHKFEKHYK